MPGFDQSNPEVAFGVHGGAIGCRAQQLGIEEKPRCDDDMDVLFVNSIRDSGTGRMVSSHPNAGAMLVISGLGVRGIPETRFKLVP